MCVGREVRVGKGVGRCVRVWLVGWMHYVPLYVCQVTSVCCTQRD